MWGSIAIVAGVLTAALAARRLWGLWRRRRGHARLADAPRLREARGVTVYGTLAGLGEPLGLRPGRRYRAIADLIVTADRAVLTTTRGVWLDAPRASASRLRSVRSPGPDRLVLEGELPTAGAEGAYRFELVLTDARGWAATLAPFAREGAVQGPAGLTGVSSSSDSPSGTSGVSSTRAPP